MVVEFIEPLPSASAFIWCSFYLMKTFPLLLILQVGLLLVVSKKVARRYRDMTSNFGEGLILLEEMGLNKTASVQCESGSDSYSVEQLISSSEEKSP